jgi:2-oxoisovalerate dehydrogenase E1 component
MEDVFFPQTDWILDTIHERIVPLAGHTTTTVQTSGEMLRRNRLGL